jgi:hypothetical protein
MTALNRYARIRVSGEPVMERDPPIRGDAPYMEIAAPTTGGLADLSVHFANRGFCIMRGTWAQVGFVAAALNLAFTLSTNERVMALDSLIKLGVEPMKAVMQAYGMFEEDWDRMKGEVGV